VLPHTESKRHLLRLYYMQGQVWVEDISSTQQALVDNVPLTGTRCLKPGAVLKIGEATIAIVEE
jgi:pSer/pThr/pTyr-binding forkhead associated (FHA) protein